MSLRGLLCMGTEKRDDVVLDCSREVTDKILVRSSPRLSEERQKPHDVQTNITASD